MSSDRSQLSKANCTHNGREILIPTCLTPWSYASVNLRLGRGSIIYRVLFCPNLCKLIFQIKFTILYQPFLPHIPIPMILVAIFTFPNSSLTSFLPIHTLFCKSHREMSLFSPHNTLSLCASPGHTCLFGSHMPPGIYIVRAWFCDRLGRCLGLETFGSVRTCS